MESHKVKLGVWKKAIFDKNKGYNYLGNNKIKADDNNTYHAGFHIFLTKRAAQQYCWGWGDLYEVEYKNITAFGVNEVSRCPSRNRITGASCIIAQYIRYVRKISK